MIKTKKQRKKIDLSNNFYERQIRRRSKQKKKQRKKTNRISRSGKLEEKSNEKT